jgi:UDP-hydrolysing UDP-N-acetyl-D-glucosamine 2-epimerase
MVIADRSETLGVAVASSLCQIPLIHLQGGEVSGSIDNKIRDANTKLADLHLTTNSLSKDRLLSLGERPSLIHIIGCPSIDLVVETLAKESGFRVSDVPGVGADIDNGDTFGIVMFHPDTLNETENMFWLGKIIEFVETSSHKWIWFWPNSDHGNTLISKELRRQRERGKLSNVRFVINLPPEDFILLANLSLAIVGNSSFGIREASFLGIPALNLGKRQSGRQVSKNVISIDEQANSDRMSEVYGVERSDVGVDTLYGDGTAGFLATQILAKWEPKLK